MLSSFMPQSLVSSNDWGSWTLIYSGQGHHLASPLHLVVDKAALQGPSLCCFRQKKEKKKSHFKNYIHSLLKSLSNGGHWHTVEQGR